MPEEAWLYKAYIEFPGGHKMFEQREGYVTRETAVFTLRHYINNSGAFDESDNDFKICLTKYLKPQEQLVELTEEETHVIQAALENINLHLNN